MGAPADRTPPPDDLAAIRARLHVEVAGLLERRLRGGLWLLAAERSVAAGRSDVASGRAST